MALTSFDNFRDIMYAYGNFSPEDDALLRDMWNSSQNYLSDNIDPQLFPDLLASSPDAPQSYKNYVANFDKIKKADVNITTVAQWNQARSVYRQTMRYYGLTDLANNDTADKFIMNGVSAQEAADRMDIAFNAINNADDALKKQLQDYFPSLATKDIVANILGVGKTVDQLKQEIGTAGIKAEQATAGLTGTLSAEELYKQGVTRQAARAGYQELAQSLQPTTAAAERAGIDTQNLQNELEKENLLGLASQRRKKIQKAEQNLFSGQSGTANISLGQSSVGKF